MTLFECSSQPSDKEMTIFFSSSMQMNTLTHGYIRHHSTYFACKSQITYCKQLYKNHKSFQSFQQILSFLKTSKGIHQQEISRYDNDD